MKRKLILHFDVNETILVGDPAGGDSFEECLNKIVAKSAFIKIPKDSKSKLFWYDDSPVINKLPAPPPPPLWTKWVWPKDCVPFYRSSRATKQIRKKFTDLVGVQYKPVVEEMRDALLWGTLDDNSIDERLLHKSQNEHHYLLPAFFKTISKLSADNRTFSIVIRTFGSDSDDVFEALHAWCANLHPLSPNHLNIKPPTLDMVFQGRYDDDDRFTLRRRSTGELIADEDQVVRILEGTHDESQFVVIQDDYQHWADGNYHPSCGKPLWITLNDDTTHHIFFDDNIHNIEDDAIVAVRQRRTRKDRFRALSGEETLELQGVHLVRVPTVEPILNDNWFYEQIQRCERNLAVKKEKAKQI